MAYLNKVISRKSLQFFSFIENVSINKLAGSLQDLYLERGKLLGVYAAESETVKRIDEQINDTYKVLRDEVVLYTKRLGEELAALNDRAGRLQSRINDITDKNLMLYSQLIKRQRINREMKVLKQSLQTFSMRREEAAVDLSGSAIDIFSLRVLRRPFFSGKPIFPKKRTLIPIGVLVGLLTGFSLGFLREYFDHTFKKPEDLDRYAGQPVLFSIPLWEQ